MSQKQIKHGSPGMRTAKGGGKKNEKNSNANPLIESKYKENVVKKLYDYFQDSFDLELIASVAHTCQWDLGRSTEALMILSGTNNSSSKKGKNTKSHKNDPMKNKTKSLPSTLKSHKSDSEKGNDSLYAVPNGLRSNPAHVSTNSLSSGQVWQRHYKSKPQSPGLLTMIPPHGKEVVKLKKTGSARSLPPISTTKNKEFPEVKKTSTAILRIQQLVQNNVKVMILMRGVPGSGKTHLAQVVVSLVTSNELSQHIFSTDDYFIMLGRGHFAYDSNQLPQAHNWNQKRVSEALRRATNPVVVDNTHTQAWEMQPYVTMAVQHGYLIEVLEPVTPWRNKEAELARRNVHSVPREKIRQMLDRYEPGWTGDKLLECFDLKYTHCGVSHVPQEVTSYSNSPLAQHRQQAVFEAPEKPKRKKNSPKKKDRRALAGIEITEDREKQLEELNQLFAEYGTKMDAVSKRKVLESGVPIPEVVSRMRKLQGNVLPLPKKSVPPTIPEVDIPKRFYDPNVIKPVPNYGCIPRESPSESLEPDTMSSSNASETSECETDTDAELAGLKYSIDYECGRFVEGEDNWEDDDEDDSRAKSEGAVGGKSFKLQSLVTSSQEELSLIDFELSTTPGSVEESSLIDFGIDSPNAKERSSSSSEEQETQLLTLQESLSKALNGHFEKERLESGSLSEPEVDYQMPKITEETNDFSENKNSESDEQSRVQSSITVNKPQIELSDSLLEVINKRLQIADDVGKTCASIQPEGSKVVLNDSLLEILMRKYDNQKPDNVVSDVESNSLECKKSPDLEEIPLPCIPPEDKPEKVQDKKPKNDAWPMSKHDLIEDIMKTWEHPREPEGKEPKDYSSPKPARPKSAIFGAVKKTGIQRDKSPEEILRSNDLSWSSIQFTSSWEDIRKKSGSQEFFGVPKAQKKPIEKCDASTMTSHADFELWKSKDYSGSVLIAKGRNINEGNVQAAPFQPRVPGLLMLDKGCMTEEAEFHELDNSKAVEILAVMFPDVPIDQLSDIVETCKGSLNWAAELLLESSPCLDSAVLLKSAEELPTKSPKDEKSLTSAFDGIIADGKKTIKRRKDRKGASSELSQMLKKQIEDSIHINEDLYQDKTLFLKKLRHGEIEFGDGPIEPIPPPPFPSQPENYSILTDLSDGWEVPSSKVKEDTEKEAAAVEEDDEDDDEDEEDEEEMIEMKMDPGFFDALKQQFGSGPEMSLTSKAPGLTPVVNIPRSLAQQIYHCWLESVNHQIEEMQNEYETMVKEDELLAAALQEQEHDQRKVNFREIMDMEFAMALYKQDQEQRTESMQETMAAKLSKQLLFEAYPNMDKKTLLDLFHSHGNSFQKTVEVLSSQESDRPKTVMSSEFLSDYEQKAIEQAKMESLKLYEENAHKPIIIVKETEKTKKNSDILVVDPADFRQEITLLHQRRNDYCQRAQDAIRKKNYSVASYFSHLASLYKERIREMNRASISLNIFNEKSDQVSTKLDLHFLFVSEALQVLDLFLDHHISRLKKLPANTLELYLITGRGLRSHERKSKIKPAVQNRLDQRNLPYVEDNPGMLKVTIRKTDAVSDDL